MAAFLPLLALGISQVWAFPDLGAPRTALRTALHTRTRTDRGAVPVSVLRPTDSKHPCSEKPFEFLDRTTDSCDSCGSICGAGGLKRTKWCLKEPNCRGLDGVWDCTNASCDATCYSTTTIDNLYIGQQKCVCLLGKEQIKLGGFPCQGSPWSNCTKDIENFCFEANQSKIIIAVQGCMLGFLIIIGILYMAWTHSVKISKWCMQYRTPHLSIPVEDPEEKPHFVRRVDDPVR